MTDHDDQLAIWRRAAECAAKLDINAIINDLRSQHDNQ